MSYSQVNSTHMVHGVGLPSVINVKSTSAVTTVFIVFGWTGISIGHRENDGIEPITTYKHVLS